MLSRTLFRYLPFTRSYSSLTILNQSAVDCLSKSPLDAVKAARERIARVIQAIDTAKAKVSVVIPTTKEEIDTSYHPFLEQPEHVELWAHPDVLALRGKGSSNGLLDGQAEAILKELKEFKIRGPNLSFEDKVELYAFITLVKKLGWGHQAGVSFRSVYRIIYDTLQLEPEKRSPSNSHLDYPEVVYQVRKSANEEEYLKELVDQQKKRKESLLAPMTPEQQELYSSVLFKTLEKPQIRDSPNPLWKE